jgi:hypothetical protein
MSDKKFTKKQLKLIEDDIVVSSLKTKYFELLKQENYPKTKTMTSQLDEIENTISERINSLTSK